MKKIILLLIIFNSNAVTGNSFEDKIHKADLIITGKLIDYYEQMETVKIINNDKIRPKDLIYTTFVFAIEDILKGKFMKETIEVKLLGGCDEELRKCSKYNKKQYYYDIDNTENSPLPLLFLSKETLNNFYQSSQDSETAFLIHGALGVITDEDWIPIYYSTNKKNDGKDIVTLEILINQLEAYDE